MKLKYSYFLNTGVPVAAWPGSKDNTVILDIGNEPKEAGIEQLQLLWTQIQQCVKTPLEPFLITNIDTL